MLSHPLRSALGAVAVAAAVATLAIVVTALDGVARFAEETSARSFGADTFVLSRLATPGRLSRKELADKQRRHLRISDSEVRFLDAYSKGDVIYAPTVRGVADVSARGRIFERAAISGTVAGLAEIRDLDIGAGRFLDPSDDRRAAQVIVLGADIAETLFPARDPLGQTVRLAGRGFRVVGIQNRQGSLGGTSQDRYAFIPLTAFERAFGAPATLEVYATAAGSATTPYAEDHARASLRARRQLRPEAEDNFDLLSPDSARGFVLRLTQRVGAAAGPISAMALLAAIVVVANTTLVSVAQRTREIGVRRALGARRSHIVLETLLESSLVALHGGALGIAIVVISLAGLQRLLPFALNVSAVTLFVGMAASLVSGALAGLYPALLAARIDIVEALRSE